MGICEEHHITWHFVSKNLSKKLPVFAFEVVGDGLMGSADGLSCPWSASGAFRAGAQVTAGYGNKHLRQSSRLLLVQSPGSHYSKDGAEAASLELSPGLQCDSHSPVT